DVTVDDNTMTYPLFRDYLAQADRVPIEGRAHGSDFVSYSLAYTQQGTAAERHLFAGPITLPVVATGRLADWNITSLPDGGRYLLELAVQLVGGATSVLTNPVIIDRSAKPGWPKRVEAITHSVVLADVVGDARQEVLVVTHPGELYVWDIDGTLLWKT